MSGQSEAANKPSRRSEIIAATIRVIGRKGLAGTSIRAIAHEVGQTIGVVTHHFRDKSELLCAALEACFQPWQDLVQSSRTIKDPMERLQWIMMETLTDQDVQRQWPSMRTV
jgi:AcrR family transcriptional regulator